MWSQRERDSSDSSERWLSSWVRSREAEGGSHGGYAFRQRARSLAEVSLCHQHYCVAQPPRTPNNVALNMWFSDQWLSLPRKQEFSWHPPWSLCMFLDIGLHPRPHSRIVDGLQVDQARSGPSRTPPTPKILDKLTHNKSKIHYLSSISQVTEDLLILSSVAWAQLQGSEITQPYGSPWNLVCNSDWNKVIKLSCMQEFFISSGEWNSCCWFS